MTIKKVMTCLLGVLSILLLIAQGRMFWQSYQAYEAAAHASSANEVTSDLLKAASSWAMERGVTNSALALKDPASEDVLKKIGNLRKAGDEAYRSAIALLGDAALTPDQEISGHIRKAESDLGALRATVDLNLTQPQPLRAKDLGTKWMPGITALIIETQKLRINLSSQALTASSALGKDTLIRHSVWLMTEYAGRERGTLASLIASGDPISPDQAELLATYRGKVEEGWNILTSIDLSKDEHDRYDQALQDVRKDFFGSYESVRQKIYADAKLGVGYSMSANDWIARSTQAIATLENIQDVSTSWGSAFLNASQASSKQGMVLYAALLIFATATVVTAITVINRRVIGPINALAESMKTIAGGALEQDVPYLHRSDEVGFMAESVEVFRQNGLEKLALERNAKLAEEKAATERRQAMLDLADRFESSVKGVVNGVTSASTEMQSAAQSLSATAEETTRQSTTVAAASEQASANVQT
ncbi:MAG: HAMP domain-containing protein, partial [Rhodospirillaceae bacterium]